MRDGRQPTPSIKLFLVGVGMAKMQCLTSVRWFRRPGRRAEPRGSPNFAVHEGQTCGVKSARWAADDSLHQLGFGRGGDGKNAVLDQR